MSHAIEVHGVSKRYGDGPLVLDGIDFYARSGEFVSFVGPSGCGKSTLFNIVTGLLAPSSGRVLVNGVETTGSPSRSIGYVLQKDLLMPWRTIMRNVILGLEVHRVGRAEARRRASALFDAYHLTGHEDAYPGQLSGGMRQRAALMRTMVTDPDIILMDEAYKALDYPLKIQLESELMDTVKAAGKTVVFVTHDIEEAVTLSDRVYVLKAHPGQLVQEIEIDLGTDSHAINERRLASAFNDYYETIWRSIGAGGRTEVAA
ncbi:MAG TPA: ABC transporter ATP-binding protein [Lacisediminihabitans sp.]|uniref:ABC transporter ATP-binding protein n=1 Tax=Lacisediminihabitans sp. TaxID=2787631 RepID=UPI002EDAF30C